VFRRCDPLPNDPERAATGARAVAAEVRGALLAELRAADPALVALAWSRAVEAVVEVVREECREPTPTRRFLEWPFRFALADHRSGDEALDLTLAGTLDRADLWVDPSGRVVAARVLDYKNAKRDADHTAKLDPQRAMGSTSFQIPVYALALAASDDLTWAPDADIRGGYVLLRAGRKTVTRPLAPGLLARDPAERRTAESRGAAAPIANRIVELVAGALDGRFDVDPRECSPFCEYRHVCRYEPPPEEGE